MPYSRCCGTGWGVDPSVDNFLKITHEARLLGTDARLIDKDAPNNPDGKLNKVAENVWKEYVKGNADGHIGCQLIFSDIGTPGPDKDFTIYDYLKHIDFLSTDFELRIGSGGTTHSAYYSSNDEEVLFHILYDLILTLFRFVLNKKPPNHY